MAVGWQDAPIAPEFTEIVNRHTEGLALTPEAHRVISALLRRGSAAIEATPAEERGDALQEAVQRLEPVVFDIAEEFRSRGVQTVDAPALTELMRLRCPLPPFCYGEEDMLSPLTAEGGADTARVRVPLPIPTH
jgi:hypothetical protein